MVLAWLGAPNRCGVPLWTPIPCPCRFHRSKFMWLGDVTDPTTINLACLFCVLLAESHAKKD